MAGGGGAKQVEGGPKKARIEIIPLIDVIFFLLATFVLFTLSLDKIASIPVNLPVANPQPGPPDENMLSIQVSEESTLYWKIGQSTQPEIVGLGDLEGRLRSYKNEMQTNARVLVRGDIRAKFGPAVQVLDEVRKAGIDQVSVETIASPTGK